MGKKPNILFIIIDAARADHFSCYGSANRTSPHIDQIAAEGVVYENAITAAGWTLPSHTSMFTGTYISKHGVSNENHVYDHKYILMPEVLKRAGYRTVGFCTNDWISDATGLSRGFSEFFNFQYPKLIHKTKRFLNSLQIHGKDSWAFAINRNVKNWIHKNAGEKPFFMFLHYGELHLPYQVPPPFNAQFLPKGMTYAEAQTVNQDPKAFYAGVAKMTARDFEISKALYDGALAYIDHRIFELYQYLKNLGQLDNTMIIISSDHGESLGDHGHFDHYYVLYEGLLRVPLIIRYPEKFPAGSRFPEAVQTLDLLPTLKEMLELRDPELNEMQGIPLPPFKNPGREFTISERFKDLKGLKKSYPDRDLSHLARWELDRKVAIRTKKYKLIASENYESELYDLEHDRLETKNLINEQPEVAKDLQNKIANWRQSFTVSNMPGKEAEFDDAVRKRLESLGYLG